MLLNSCCCCFGILEQVGRAWTVVVVVDCFVGWVGTQCCCFEEQIDIVEQSVEGFGTLQDDGVSHQHVVGICVGDVWWQSKKEWHKSTFKNIGKIRKIGKMRKMEASKDLKRESS